MAAPALGLGLTIAVGSFLLQGWLIPDCNSASDNVLAGLSKTGAGKQKNLMVQIPNAERPDRVLWAHDLDLNTQTLHQVLIVEIHDGQWGLSYAAESAHWEGKTWVLTKVKLTQNTASGPLSVDLPSVRYDIGKSPWELAQAKRSLQDMSMDELARLGQAPPGGDTQQAREAREEMQMRAALPWAALGLALVGLPLGIRPQRTSTGMGLGLSLGIILVYYIVIQLMRVLGQQGALPPALSDWIPNVLLYTIALGLLVNASR
jgi:lipopolysaccharide export system permease protein